MYVTRDNRKVKRSKPPRPCEMPLIACDLIDPPGDVFDVRKAHGGLAVRRLSSNLTDSTPRARIVDGRRRRVAAPATAAEVGGSCGPRGARIESSLVDRLVPRPGRRLWRYSPTRPAVPGEKHRELLAHELLGGTSLGQPATIARRRIEPHALAESLWLPTHAIRARSTATRAITGSQSPGFS